jgi:hypothetical protein
MADSNRLVYELSQAESTRWQQGGPAALAFQHQLAELHRQGMFGLSPSLDVVHPDGILAAQHTAHAPAQDQAAPQVAQTFSLPAEERHPGQEQEAAPVRDLGRAEGTLIETATVTAYQMSANESAAWSRGDHEARMVEANIGDALKDVGTHQPVAVLLDDGRAMYTQGESLFETFTASMSLLRDRLSALASGVQVHLDFSVQLGKPQTTAQTGLEALQERAEHLSKPTPQHAREQGMNY